MRGLFLFITVFFSYHVFGQIVDDSTKQVYGPSTTKFITEDIVLNDSVIYSRIDTSIYLLERQSVVDKNNHELQDLGLMGTAQFPVFYTPAKSIGRSSGYTAYSSYALKPSDIKYYDTKSPFIDLLIMLGGGNRNKVDVGVTRNINPNWNAGFNFKTLAIDKQLSRDRRGDRQVESSAFSAHTHYKHDKIPYQVLAHFSLLNHNVVELGGVRYFDTDSTETDLFQFDNALLRLEEAQSFFRDRRFHLYQDYQLAEAFQLYHIADRHTEVSIFEDFADSDVGDYNPFSDFYDAFLIDEDSTYQRANFSSFSNEAGIKGNVSNVFYRGYVRMRWVDFFYNYFAPDLSAFEQYVGGFAKFKWKDKFSVEANGEVILGEGFDLKGNISSNFINAYYRSTNYAVPYIFNDYFGNHHEWHNDFDPTFVNQLGGNIKFKVKFAELVPSIDLVSYQNYLLFDEDIVPIQNTGTFVVTKIGGNANFRFLNKKGEGWHFENQFYFTNVVGDGASQIRIPQFFYNGRFFWRGEWFKDAVSFEWGIDAHTRSSYYATTFAPEVQQFYLQNDFEIPSYLATNVFINMRLYKFLMSLKFTHVNQPDDGGYFTSPYYPGQPRVFDVLVKWRFFN